MSAEWDALVEAGARALAAAGDCHYACSKGELLCEGDMSNCLAAEVADIVLSAALRVTLPAPCLTCGDTKMVKTREMACGDCPLPSSEPCCDRAACPDHHPSRWAVLPVLQELGVAALTQVDGYDTEFSDAATGEKVVIYKPGLFRPAPTPENPEVSE